MARQQKSEAPTTSETERHEEQREKRVGDGNSQVRGRRVGLLEADRWAQRPAVSSAASLRARRRCRRPCCARAREGSQQMQPSSPNCCGACWACWPSRVGLTAAAPTVTFRWLPRPSAPAESEQRSGPRRTRVPASCERIRWRRRCVLATCVAFCPGLLSGGTKSRTMRMRFAAAAVPQDSTRIFRSAAVRPPTPIAIQPSARRASMRKCVRASAWNVCSRWCVICDHADRLGESARSRQRRRRGPNPCCGSGCGAAAGDAGGRRARVDQPCGHWVHGAMVWPAEVDMQSRERNEWWAVGTGSQVPRNLDQPKPCNASARDDDQHR